MTLVWLLLSTASVFTLKQYAQKESGADGRHDEP